MNFFFFFYYWNGPNKIIYDIDFCLDFCQNKDEMEERIRRRGSKWIAL